MNTRTLGQVRDCRQHQVTCTDTHHSPVHNVPCPCTKAHREANQLACSPCTLLRGAEPCSSTDGMAGTCLRGGHERFHGVEGVLKLGACPAMMQNLQHNAVGLSFRCLLAPDDKQATHLHTHSERTRERARERERERDTHARTRRVLPWVSARARSNMPSHPGLAFCVCTRKIPTHGLHR